MDEIDLALNPPQFVKSRSTPPIRAARSPSPVWPLAALNGREPVVLPSPGDSRGIELAYPRLNAGDAITTCPPNTPNGTETHLMPQMTAVFSVDDGEIVYAGRSASGYRIIVNHDNDWASHYANLEAIVAIRTDLYRSRAQYVRAGDVIGYVGAPEPGAFKRLYFELWQLDHSRHFKAVDPRLHLTDWQLKREYDHFTPAPPTAQQEAA
jgi:hypothetical protein